MKKRYWIIGAGAVIVALNVMVPACGNKSNSVPSNYYGANCIPGQVCTGVSGTPLLSTPATASIDNYGSMAAIQVYASNYTAGYAYSGSVNVQAQVYISQYNQYMCPPNNYVLTGTGTWQSSGSGLGVVTAQLTGTSGFSVQMRVQLFQGQDQYQSQSTQYYFQGNFGNSCDQSAVAL